LTSQSALGLHTAIFGGPAADQARAFAAWRTAVLAIGGTVLLRDRPAEVDDLVDALGPAPSSAALLRALRTRLDPDERCAPGRLGRWLTP
jgi:glycolate oxidase FAD binding subunit